jgi:hypothetical protein
MNATPAAKKNNMILAAVAAGGILGKIEKLFKTRCVFVQR